MQSDIIAGLFGKMFNLLAADPEKNGPLARKLWSLTMEYEVDHFLMGCDSALQEFNLARKDDEGFMHYNKEMM